MSKDYNLRQQLAQSLAPPVGLAIDRERIPQAAVTILIREEDGDHQLLLIKRAIREGDPWSGHLALPGGRAEWQDIDLVETAARETCEEIGIDLLGPDSTRDRFIGHLPVLSPQSPGIPPIEITPFVAMAPPTQELRLSAEVCQTWWLSINQLLERGLSTEYRHHSGSLVRKWPAYESPGGPVWGITERILTTFLAIFK